jgi:cation-transporting P-type ATPase 13A2
LCKRESIPDNFDKNVEKYSKEGYRVLGVCYKDLGK